MTQSLETKRSCAIWFFLRAGSLYVPTLRVYSACSGEGIVGAIFDVAARCQSTRNHRTSRSLSPFPSAPWCMRLVVNSVLALENARRRQIIIGVD